MMQRLRLDSSDTAKRVICKQLINCLGLAFLCLEKKNNFLGLNKSAYM